jgi:hypothetical protein
MAGFFVLAWLPLTAYSAEPPVALTLIPVQQSGSYFDLTMSPGTSRALAVELVNASQQPTAARYYAADAYTLVNGGFGARATDQPRDGATAWLDFPTTRTTLAPGTTTQNFTVTVPATAAPGDYVTSLVIENASPITQPGAEGIAQTIRSAIAVSIHVPGAAHPAALLGAITYETSGTRDQLEVPIANTGNVRIAPQANLTLTDSANSVRWSHSIRLGSIYAGTATELQTALPTTLPAGRYTVEMTLTDQSHGLATARARSTMTIGAASVPAQAAPASGRSPAFDLTVGGISLVTLAAVAAIVVIERNKAIEGRRS